MLVLSILFLNSVRAVSSEEKSKYQSDLEAFIQEMDRTYPFFDLKGIRDDWKTVSARIREEAEACKSDDAFLFHGIEPDERIEAAPDEVQRGLNSEILKAETYLLKIGRNPSR